MWPRSSSPAAPAAPLPPPYRTDTLPRGVRCSSTRTKTKAFPWPERPTRPHLQNIAKILKAFSVLRGRDSDNGNTRNKKPPPAPKAQGGHVAGEVLLQHRGGGVVKREGGPSSLQAHHHVYEGAGVLHKAGVCALYPLGARVLVHVVYLLPDCRGPLAVVVHGEVLAVPAKGLTRFG